MKERLAEINKTAGEIVLENGLLLKELKDNAYYREFHFESFDECIQAWHDAGVLEYGPRNARNFIAVIEMIEKNGYDTTTIKDIPISKLREIASIPLADEQRKLLGRVHDMTTAEVQCEAKRLRDKAHGRDSDPTKSLKVICSDTQLTFYRECLSAAKRVFSMNDEAPDADALEAILADWRAGAVDPVPAIEVTDWEVVT